MLVVAVVVALLASGFSALPPACPSAWLVLGGQTPLSSLLPPFTTLTPG